MSLIFRFEKEHYPGIHDLLSRAEFASVLGMHATAPAVGPMTIQNALSDREVAGIEAKLSAMTQDQRNDLVNAMECEDEEIENLLNNWAEYAGLI